VDSLGNIEDITKRESYVFGSFARHENKFSCGLAAKYKCMEILIKNGVVFDGSGKKGEKTDVLIKGGVIVSIGNFKDKKAEIVIDASDSYITPGFIDINSDSDHYLTIFTEPTQISLLKQGITTILGGNCGSSLAPLIKGDLVSIRKWANPNQINVDWTSFGEFLENLSRFKLGVNFGSLVGHSTVRRGLIGEEFRDLTEEELQQMKHLMEKSLEEGAFGISTGLSYSHSRITPPYEIEELLKILGKYDALYATHLRSEEEGLVASIAEIDDIVSELKIKGRPKIEISHFKAYEGLLDDLNLGLKIINSLKEKGADINFDVYPYETIAGPLYLYLPSWAIYGGFELMVKNITDKMVRPRIIKDLKEKKYQYNRIIVAEMSGTPSFIGKNIQELAKTRGISPEEMLLETLKIGGGRVIVFENKLSSEETIALLKHPLSIIATNGPGRNYARVPEVLPHPRSFGAFPKFLSLARDKKIMDWPEAIKKITYLAAQKIGLKKRGLIKKGYFADIVVFNPKQINSMADCRNPYLEPEGIEFVIVNGELAVDHSRFTGVLAGQIFKR